jgi:hypothetical protein
MRDIPNKIVYSGVLDLAVQYAYATLDYLVV